MYKYKALGNGVRLGRQDQEWEEGFDYVMTDEPQTNPNQR